VAKALSRLVSDSNRRMILRIRHGQGRLTMEFKLNLCYGILDEIATNRGA